MAALYPQVSIGGSVGLTGPLKDFGTGSAFGFSLGPLVSWSFPNRPVVRAQIAQADAQVRGRLAGFDGAVLEALRQAESALKPIGAMPSRRRRSIGRGTARRYRRRRRASCSASAGDFLSLLDAQRSLASAEVTAANARAQLVQDQIALFLALGGGWD